MAFSGLWTLAGMRDSYRSALDSGARQLEAAGGMSAAQHEMATSQRSLVLYAYANSPAGAESAAQTFQNGAAKLRKAIAGARPLASSEDARRAVDAIESDAASWVPAFADLRRVVALGDPDAAAGLLNDRIFPMHKRMAENIAKVESESWAVLRRDMAAAGSNYEAARNLVWGLLVAAAGIAFLAIAITRRASAAMRELGAELLNGSHRLAAASGQVAAAGHALVQGASEQAATLGETSASTTEITAVTRKNAENTRAMAGLMTETAALVKDANQNLEQMVEQRRENRVVDPGDVGDDLLDLNQVVGHWPEERCGSQRYLQIMT
jgi:methyl-accepting chemotaxis protein/methyl-accepting chemotaxis protein-1 (serine sensor receptor)